eukprot:4550639-Pleurochrysis_carterae.AAC.1
MDTRSPGGWSDALGVASPSTLLSRSCYLLQFLVSIVAASDRDDYGRASNECGVWKLLQQQGLPATPIAHDHTVGTEAKSPVDHGAAMR